MCGIAGLLRWNGLEAGDAERVQRAAQTLAHRGPDGAGFWRDSRCALGFRRLKVIDLTPAGDQPMANEDGTVHVVFNGEIYNFRELRAELESRGHVFRSRGDTETLLHGYEQWGGEELLGRLRGMFAFALWDARERRLVLARDALGVKPLYVAERGDAILFASEPKALFATGLVPPALDPVALHEALTYRYVPPPRSGFRDVEKLPPGHWAVAHDEALTYRPWFALGGAREPEEGARADAGPSWGSAVPGAARLPEVLGAAVARRLTADVPLGAWLSGGMDSGLVASWMREAGPVRTYAAGFAQPDYDERDLARASAQHLRTEHAEFEVPADVFSRLPQIVWHADEPFFDSSCLPAFVLAEATKPHVTVALSGDGGDESFAGYERYVGLRYLRQWRALPGFVRRLALGVAGSSGAPSRHGWARRLAWLERCRQTGQAGFHPYLAAMTLFAEPEIHALYGEALAEENAELDGREYLANALKRATLAAGQELQPGVFPVEPGVLQRADLATYLPGDVLHKVDRMSMAHGLEVRSPFLDVDLVRWALELPDAERLPGSTTKPLLRKLAAGRLPPAVCQAPKRGFGVPLDEWFRGPLQKPALELFAASRLAAARLFRPGYWEPYWREHQARRAQHGERLYAFLALEVWYRTFLDGTPALDRPGPLA